MISKSTKSGVMIAVERIMKQAELMAEHLGIPVPDDISTWTSECAFVCESEIVRLFEMYGHEDVGEEFRRQLINASVA